MKNEIVSIATQEKSKAELLNKLLSENGIEVYVEKIGNTDDPYYCQDVYSVKVPVSSLSRSIYILEDNDLSDYAGKLIQRADDGKLRFLIATDFSENSLKACELAFSLAKRHNGEIKILHVYHNVHYPSHFPFVDQIAEANNGKNVALLENAEQSMNAFISIINSNIENKKWPYVNYSYTIKEGSVPNEITNYANLYNPFLVIVGTKGEHLTDGKMFGSVAAEVLEMLNIPVLAVPINSPISNIADLEHMAYMISLREWNSKSFEQLEKVLSFSHIKKITLLNICQNPTEKNKTESQLGKIREALEGKFQDKEIFQKVIESNDVIEATTIFLNETKISLLCINTKRRNFLERIFIPSVSRKILMQNDTALLVLRG